MATESTVRQLWTDHVNTGDLSFFDLHFGGWNFINRNVQVTKLIILQLSVIIVTETVKESSWIFLCATVELIQGLRDRSSVNAVNQRGSFCGSQKLVILFAYSLR